MSIGATSPIVALKETFMAFLLGNDNLLHHPSPLIRSLMSPIIFLSCSC
jgi:hypothetical protein